MMSGFLLAAVVMAAAFVVALVLPLLTGKAPPPASVADETTGALRAQLREIAQQKAVGLLGDEAADQSAIDAKRSALAAAGSAGSEANGLKTTRSARLAVLAAIGVCPVLLAFLYLEVGSPGAFDPAAIAARAALDPAGQSEAERAAMIDAMVARLEERLVENPNDAEGWRMLARSQAVLGRYAESAASFQNLFRIASGDEDDWRSYAEVQIQAAPEGVFPADAAFLATLDRIEALAPGDAFVAFYRGGAARESGDFAAASRVWRKLLSDIPADAPARDTLERLIEQVERNHSE